MRSTANQPTSPSKTTMELFSSSSPLIVKSTKNSATSSSEQPKEVVIGSVTRKCSIKKPWTASLCSRVAVLNSRELIWKSQQKSWENRDFLGKQEEKEERVLENTQLSLSFRDSLLLPPPMLHTAAASLPVSSLQLLQTTPSLLLSPFLDNVTFAFSPFFYWHSPFPPSFPRFFSPINNVLDEGEEAVAAAVVAGLGSDMAAALQTRFTAKVVSRRKFWMRRSRLFSLVLTDFP